MAQNKNNVNIENLDKWLDWLEGLEKEHIDRFKSRVLRSAALRGMEYTQDYTPVRSGILAGSFRPGDKNNIFLLKVGKKTSYVVYGTVVKYVRYVEEGFEQEAGRFVPGFWRNGVFHYIPYEEAKAQGIGGMVLTGAKVEGAHMIQKGFDDMQEDLDDIVEFEFKRLYAELFD